MKLILNRESIGSILVSSLEVLEKECAGLLFGIVNNGEIKCSIAFPIQQAKRNEDSVIWKKAFEKVIEYSQYCILGYNFLGIYHSHNNCSELSEEDINLFKSDNRYKISLLVNIRDNKENEKFWDESGGILKSYIDDKCIEFSGFIKNNKGQVEVLPVSSPCKDTFNLFPKVFGIKPSDVLLLKEPSMGKVHYSINKIDFNFSRISEGKVERGENNNEYHIKKIKEIIDSELKNKTTR